MALVNPAALYGGGAFIVDTKPAMDFYLRQQAKQQAKEDALNKYFEGLVSNKTPFAGRDQDFEAFEQALKNAQQKFAATDMKEISRNPAKRLELQQALNIPGQIVSLSKIAKANEDKLNASYFNNKDVRPRIPNEIWGRNDDMQPIYDEKGNPTGWEASQEPVAKINPDGSIGWNERYKPLDQSKITLLPELKSAKEMQDIADNQVYGFDQYRKEISRKKDPNDPAIDIITYGFEQPVMLTMADRFRVAYKQDPSVARTFRETFPKKFENINIGEFNRANEAYKMATGKDIEPGNFEDLYVGKNLADKAIQKEERKVNVTRKSEMQQARQERTAMRLIGARAAAKGGGGGAKSDKMAYSVVDKNEPGPIPKTRLRIENDENGNNVVLDENGIKYNGTVELPGGMIGSEVKGSVKGVKPLLLQSGTATVKDGVIQSIKFPYEIGTVNRSVTKKQTEQEVQAETRSKSGQVAPTTKKEEAKPKTKIKGF